MGRPSDKPPLLVSARAVQRLQAIHRQHKPDQPAPAIDPALAAVSPTEAGLGVTQSLGLRIAVLNEPVSQTPSDPQDNSSWSSERDISSELCVTCKTLCRLQLLHGSLVEVCHHSSLAC